MAETIIDTESVWDSVDHFTRACYSFEPDKVQLFNEGDGKLRDCDRDLLSKIYHTVRALRSLTREQICDNQSTNETINKWIEAGVRWSFRYLTSLCTNDIVMPENLEPDTLDNLFVAVQHLDRIFFYNRHTYIDQDRKPYLVDDHDAETLVKQLQRVALLENQCGAIACDILHCVADGRPEVQRLVSQHVTYEGLLDLLEPTSKCSFVSFGRTSAPERHKEYHPNLNPRKDQHAQLKVSRIRLLTSFLHRFHTPSIRQFTTWLKNWNEETEVKPLRTIRALDKSGVSDILFASTVDERLKIAALKFLRNFCDGADDIVKKCVIDRHGKSLVVLLQETDSNDRNVKRHEITCVIVLDIIVNLCYHYEQGQSYFTSRDIAHVLRKSNLLLHKSRDVAFAAWKVQLASVWECVEAQCQAVEADVIQSCHKAFKKCTQSTGWLQKEDLLQICSLIFEILIPDAEVKQRSEEDETAGKNSIFFDEWMFEIKLKEEFSAWKRIGEHLCVWLKDEGAKVQKKNKWTIWATNYQEEPPEGTYTHTHTSCEALWPVLLSEDSDSRYKADMLGGLRNTIAKCCEKWQCDQSELAWPFAVLHWCADQNFIRRNREVFRNDDSLEYFVRLSALGLQPYAALEFTRLSEMVVQDDPIDIAVTVFSRSLASGMDAWDLSDDRHSCLLPTARKDILHLLNSDVHGSSDIESVYREIATYVSDRMSCPHDSCAFDNDGTKINTWMSLRDIIGNPTVPEISVYINGKSEHTAVATLEDKLKEVRPGYERWFHGCVDWNAKAEIDLILDGLVSLTNLPHVSPTHDFGAAYYLFRNGRASELHSRWRFGMSTTKLSDVQDAFPCVLVFEVPIKEREELNQVCFPVNAPQSVVDLCILSGCTKKYMQKCSQSKHKKSHCQDRRISACSSTESPEEKENGTSEIAGACGADAKGSHIALTKRDDEIEDRDPMLIRSNRMGWSFWATTILHYRDGHNNICELRRKVLDDVNLCRYFKSLTEYDTNELKLDSPWRLATDGGGLECVEDSLKGDLESVSKSDCVFGALFGGWKDVKRSGGEHARRSGGKPTKVRIPTLRGKTPTEVDFQLALKSDKSLGFFFKHLKAVFVDKSVAHSTTTGKEATSVRPR
eukprot:m.1639524 g.1639524  ORF g.1639524 m.1639524 type:complete len:1126 (-) comp36306_c0_seq1:101-3478(-)